MELPQTLQGDLIMTKTRLASLAILILLATLVSGPQAGRSFSAQANEGQNGSGIQQQTAPESRTAIWEYRILIGRWDVVRVKVVSIDNWSGLAAVVSPTNLEDEINKLTAQGFVVESLQTASSAGGGGAQTGFQLSSTN
jgi:hypothetical protein